MRALVSMRRRGEPSYGGLIWLDRELVVIGVLGGLLSGLLGVGGGTLMVPFLTFAVGLSQHAAEATSLLVILPTAVAGTLALQRRGVGNAGLAVRFGLVGSIGAVLGALLAIALPAASLRLVFAIFVGIVGLELIRGGIRTRGRPA